MIQSVDRQAPGVEFGSPETMLTGQRGLVTHLLVQPQMGETGHLQRNLASKLSYQLALGLSERPYLNE